MTEAPRTWRDAAGAWLSIGAAPTWTWAPGSVLALSLTVAGLPAAALAGLGVSVLVTALRAAAGIGAQARRHAR